ncbi:MAG TPA: hypothetical protein DIC51_06500 [Coxiellaceae bacterium]|nr:hypothetical protein [Coxiellaceae bacterium]
MFKVINKITQAYLREVAIPNFERLISTKTGTPVITNENTRAAIQILWYSNPPTQKDPHVAMMVFLVSLGLLTSNKDFLSKELFDLLHDEHQQEISLEQNHSTAFLAALTKLSDDTKTASRKFKYCLSTPVPCELYEKIKQSIDLIRVVVDMPSLQQNNPFDDTTFSSKLIQTKRYV